MTKNLNDEQKSNQNKMRFTDEWEIQTIEAPGHQQEIRSHQGDRGGFIKEVRFAHQESIATYQN